MLLAKNIFTEFIEVPVAERKKPFTEITIAVPRAGIGVNIQTKH